MKGRPTNNAEKDFHDMLCQNIGCIACLIDTGVVNDYCSIHHCDGRTKPDAHWLVLPLCAGHHQAGTGAPWMKSVHGHKRDFVRMYGSEAELRRYCLELLIGTGASIPDRARELAGL